MPALKTKILFFLSSYAPLFIILAVRAYSSAWWIAVVLGLLAVAGLVFLWRYLKRVRGKTTKALTPSAVAPKDNEAVSYLLFYLFPFLNVDFAKTSDALSLLIFLCVLCILYVNSHMIYVNPMLNLFGYHFYQIESEGGKPYGLITRSAYVRKQDPISYYQISNYVIVEKEPRTS